MNVTSYRAIFFVVTIGIALVVASPLISLLIPQRDSEFFSELWLLGPDHKAEGYPFNVVAGTDYTVFVGVGNQMGSTEYYLVYVNLCNNTGYSPADNDSEPISCEHIYTYNIFIDNGKTWEQSVTFRFEDVLVAEQDLTVRHFVINDTAFPVEVSTLLNSNNEGFFELSFELWRYDVVSDSFRFDDREVSLSLKMNSSL